MTTAAERVHFADLGDIQEYTAGIPAAWIECRETNHNLRPFDVNPLEGGGWERIRRCSRCRAKRTDILDRDFNILHSSYKYPENYLMERGHGRISSEGRSIFRGANVMAEAKRASGRKH